MSRSAILCAGLLALIFLPLRSLAAPGSLSIPAPAQGVGPTTPHPILFVTQVPIPDDFTTVNAVFGNHRADMQSAGRGGDLWIRYPDGVLKNLTTAAGYGMEGLQGANAIAVRDPSIHWEGQKLDLAAPRDALDRGIGMVYQEVLLFPNLTAVENIFAGRELKLRGGRLRRGEMRERTARLLAEQRGP